HRDLWEDAPMDYLYLINGALTGLKSMRKYETMRAFLEDVKLLDTKSENLHAMVTQLVFAHEMSILIDTGQFEQGLSLVKTYESDLIKKGGVISVHTQANVYFYIGVTYFGMSDYHRALQYINEVLNIHSKYVSQQLYSLCRLLHLLLHFELGNEDFLNYELRSVERKLKAGKKLFQVEKVTIGFFKKWLRGMQKKSLLQDYHRQLLSLSKDPYEMQLLRQFDFITWIEAKIKKVAFAELVSEKNLKESVTQQMGIV
ncbi:MAG: hypothetical protein H7Y03_12960, partial [Chitinophagaceae bacterium]|nr:hypothetical protein [Chitinophagaceae bacterium]